MLTSFGCVPLNDQKDHAHLYLKVKVRNISIKFFDNKNLIYNLLGF